MDGFQIDRSSYTAAGGDPEAEISPVSDEMRRVVNRDSLVNRRRLHAVDHERAGSCSLRLLPGTLDNRRSQLPQFLDRGADRGGDVHLKRVEEVGAGNADAQATQIAVELRSCFSGTVDSVP